ncbi:GDSL-like Lipase/Acylhydrolase [Hyunsoonleella jejuensis]|uniref:GDSL-like Lipase/Acylhydrolase n=1 Tax=Hyunsoonleella jejuensis TaxID=419940 RepID=A0A1H9BKR0_9FLAO|nr:G-D-S-L family lipolytic protein [Hyunsoonleella jejuensis]SEP89515.1 GDSL-like Lipase/Acylhydrolase [Hyunsoonleella jejuensis]
MKFKYISLFALLIGFLSCEDAESPIPEEVARPELTAGTADFSNYVAIGASFTAGFTDGALFKASQENSFPNILYQQFAKLSGEDFKQPLMNDNIGGMLVNGTVQLQPRLFFNGSGPATLPATPTTEALNNLSGTFNNLGVPGAKSFHLLFDGYGNPANLALGLANPYYVRMATSPGATVLADAMAQSPTFFTLSEIGGNDVLGYATSGGDGSNPITDSGTFNASFNALVSSLTSNGAKGVVTNVPYITDLPHFTTVPHNPIPLDAATASFLNSMGAYGAYNAGVAQALAGLVQFGQITQEIADAELARRTINFEAGAGNAVVIMDESLIDLTGLNPQLISMRQATANDLLVLPASTFIGTEAVPGNPQTANGVAIPLEDKWVLTPQEQQEIKTATDAYNETIESLASSNENIALVDLNAILTEVASTGINFDGFNLTANLVTGGAISLDGIHLNARGYAFMANKFLEAIDESFGSNFIESGNVAKASNYQTNYSPTLQ